MAFGRKRKEAKAEEAQEGDVAAVEVTRAHGTLSQEEEGERTEVRSVPEEPAVEVTRAHGTLPAEGDEPPEPPEPEPVEATTPHEIPAVEEDPEPPPTSESPLDAEPVVDEFAARPHVFVGAAFVGGFVAAQIVKRLSR
jgi:hypothetical protein